MANLYSPQPISVVPQADSAAQTSSGLWHLFGGVLKYAWPIIAVIVIGSIVGALINSGKGSGGKADKADTKK